MQLHLPLDAQVLPELDALEGAHAAAVRAAVRALLDDPGGRVLLVGGRGTGKTHTLAAVCREAAQRSMSVALVPLAHAQSADAASVDEMWQYDLLCIDDIQSMAGDAARERALFRCYNECEASGTRLLMSARATPAALGIDLPDLVSRLSACIVLQMGPLDDVALQRILTARAEKLGFRLPESVCQYLLRRVSRNTHDLEKLLARVAQLSLAEQRPASLGAVRYWLHSGALDVDT
jgi:DnaA-homolog protein